MPLYTYECASCGVSEETSKRIDERHDAPECGECGQRMGLVVGATYGIVKNPAVPKQRHHTK